MQIFGRRPRQKRGSRCFVLLLPLLLLFIVLLALTIVRFPGFDRAAKITNVCLTGVVGLSYLLAALLLYRRTRRFYALGRAETYSCAAVVAEPSRNGQSIEIKFFAADAGDVRTYLVADGAGEIFSEKPVLTEVQENALADAFFQLQDSLGKIYSYQEFIPFDLNFLQNKTIFCEKQLFAQLFGAAAGHTPAANGNRFCLYEPGTEWPPVKEAWLKNI